MTLCLDFDAQELPFNIFVNREIKSGSIFFNWSTDIGSALIPSFSFHNIGSPFFWITHFFKPEYFPYLIVFIYPLKYAVAGLTAYLWLERHVEHKWLAVIGGVLYSFSGFQATNIVFYHFHEAAAFFPLLLLGFDLLIQNNEWMNVIRYRRSSEWKSTDAVVDNVLLTTRDFKNDTIPYRWNICDGTYPFSPYYNMNMAGSLTNQNSFTSTIDNGINEFYDAIDYHRHTGSPNGPEGTHELLSVRYYLIQEGDNPGDSMAGRDLILQYNNGSRDNSVYEDPEALPIGFTYDSYMTRSEFSDIYRDDRSKAMLRTLVIADEDEPAVSSCMEHISPEELSSFSTEEMHGDILNRSRESSIQFEHNSRSFSSIIEADRIKYAFFSVPYSRS